MKVSSCLKTLQCASCERSLTGQSPDFIELNVKILTPVGQDFFPWGSCGFTKKTISASMVSWYSQEAPSCIDGALAMLLDPNLAIDHWANL